MSSALKERWVKRRALLPVSIGLLENPLHPLLKKDFILKINLSVDCFILDFSTRAKKQLFFDNLIYIKNAFWPHSSLCPLLLTTSCMYKTHSGHTHSSALSYPSAPSPIPPPTKFLSQFHVLFCDPQGHL